jgi:Omp85 superfamily domain
VHIQSNLIGSIGLNRFIRIIPILLLPHVGQTQSDSVSWFNRAIARFTHDDHAPEKPRFLAYPTIAFSPETHLEFGVAASLLFHAKNDYQQNRLSEVTAFGFVTLRSQYGLWLDNAIYGDRDKWLLLGRARFQRFPLLYYGLGSDAPKENPMVVNGFYTLVRQRMYRQIRGNWFAGPQFDLQWLDNVDFGEDVPTRPLPTGANGSDNTGVGVGIVYDSRPNMLNTRQGWFAELSWLHYGLRGLGSYTFNNISAELRRYQRTGPSSVFAWQVSGSMALGDVPFNMLSLMGSEMLMRGYYTGRYRDRHYYATQAEYRWLPFPFSRYLGGAIFGAVGAVSPTFAALSINDIRWSGGAGLRYLIFPKKDIFVRFDVGFTREGAGFYIFTGEAF